MCSRAPCSHCSFSCYFVSTGPSKLNNNQMMAAGPWRPFFRINSEVWVGVGLPVRPGECWVGGLRLVSHQHGDSGLWNQWAELLRGRDPKESANSSQVACRAASPVPFTWAYETQSPYGLRPQAFIPRRESFCRGQRLMGRR